MNIDKIRIENIKISTFIKVWQIENKRENFENVETMNAKFKLEFNDFLNSNDISQENKNLFLIK